MILYADSINGCIYQIVRGECLVVDVTGCRRRLRAGDSVQRITLLDLRLWSTVIALTFVEVLVINSHELESILINGDDVLHYWQKVLWAGPAVGQPLWFLRWRKSDDFTHQYFCSQ